MHVCTTWTHDKAYLLQSKWAPAYLPSRWESPGIQRPPTRRPCWDRTGHALLTLASLLTPSNFSSENRSRSPSAPPAWISQEPWMGSGKKGLFFSCITCNLMLLSQPCAPTWGSQPDYLYTHTQKKQCYLLLSLLTSRFPHPATLPPCSHIQYNRSKAWVISSDCQRA